jgi:hypothetical protein
MSDECVVLINLLKVKPGKQDALIALLKQNTDTVVRTLHGWKTTRLIAAKNGAGVVIYSEWETPAELGLDPRLGGVQRNSARVNTQVRFGHTRNQGEPQWLGWS